MFKGIIIRGEGDAVEVGKFFIFNSPARTNCLNKNLRFDSNWSLSNTSNIWVLYGTTQIEGLLKNLDSGLCLRYKADGDPSDGEMVECDLTMANQKPDF